MEEYKILAMNFGSTSTKVAAYEGDTQLLQKVFHHSPEDLQGVSSMEDNAALRKPLILNYLKEQGVDLKEFDAIVGRGGLVRPLLGGTYAVNEKMLEDLRSCTYGTHVCNLGGILAAEIGQELGKPAYVVDPPVIDEMSDLAKLSGSPDFPRRPLFHALNQKAIAKRYATEYGLSYDSLRLIVAHMGGGVTVGTHLYGKVVDVNNGLEGDGAYTAERPGSLAVVDVLRAAANMAPPSRSFGSSSPSTAAWPLTPAPTTAGRCPAGSRRATRKPSLPTGVWPIRSPRKLAPLAPCFRARWTPFCSPAALLMTPC